MKRFPGRTMFMTRLVSRRSTATRTAIATLVAATLIGQLRLAWAATPAAAPSALGTVSTNRLPNDDARRSSERVRPVIVTDVAGKIGADTLWRLFDADARTGLVAPGPTQIRLTFAAPVSVDAIGAYGAVDGVLALRSAEGKDASGPSARLSGEGRHWTRLLAKDATPSRSFVVEWTPGQAGVLLPELEVWARASGASAAATAGAALADSLHGGLPEGAESYEATTNARAISPAASADVRSFSLSLPMDPASIERAFLVYDLHGLPHFTAAIRSINGGPGVGGFGVSLGAQGGRQVEEIAPGILQRGTNTIRFDPVSGSHPVGYRVEHVRVVVTHADSGRARAEAKDLEDGKESTGWSGGEGSARRWRFAGPTQPRELELRLAKGQSGKLVVVAGDGPDGRSRVTVDLADLSPGWHKVALDALPPVEALTMALAGGKEGALLVSELTVTGSPLPSPTRPRMSVTYPLHGECVNHEVHVRGLTTPAPVELRANGAVVKGARHEPGAFSFTASEKSLGGGSGKPFEFGLDAVQADGESAHVAVAIQGCVDRPPLVSDQETEGQVQPKEDVGAPFGHLVTPDHATTLSFAGATLDVPAGAVDVPVRITIRPLDPEQVPRLEAGMINITAGGRAFRMGPRGMLFKKPVTLSIPVDSSRIDRASAVHTFYFDEPQRQWRQVGYAERSEREVRAQTMHFTDFIAGTLALPEHPGLQSMNPTSLKDIKIADPAAALQLIAPPEPNSRGTANLSYPIVVPPGRRGMEPHLAITYDSTGGNGWLGMGWNLATSSIEIDTRFGVPQYNGTERYMLDGQALTQATSAPSGAPAGTYYLRRNEGQFDWIQRIGTAPGPFSWLITDKQGTKYTYGAATAARLIPLLPGTSNPDLVRTFKWFLEKVEDIYGNQVLYTYTTVRGQNTLKPGETVPDQWVQVYPNQINYTASSSGSPAFRYSVQFTRRTAARPDAFSTGRPGFLVLTDQLLDTVRVLNGTNTVRRYVLTYTTGEFEKSVLQHLAVHGSGTSGTMLAQHDFDYHRTPRDASDNLRVLGAPVLYTTLVNADGTGSQGSSRSDVHTSSNSDDLTVGIPYAGSVGAATQDVATTTDRMMSDANGDGLEDLLPSNESDANQQSMFLGVNNTPVVFMSRATFPEWRAPYNSSVNHYLSSHFSLLGISGGEDYGNIDQNLSTMADMNGDGFPDRVDIGSDALSVRLNKGGLLGFEGARLWPGYSKTGLHFDCSDIFSNSCNLSFNGSPGTLAFTPPQKTFPSVDIVTAWEAPFAGSVRVGGGITRPTTEVGGDGVVASLYHNNTLLWERDFGPDDTITCTPMDQVIPGNQCGAANGGFVRTVQPGDRIYTRVSAKNNTDHDVLEWDLTVRYRDNAVAEDGAFEAWGPHRYVWSEKEAQRVSGQFVRPWKAVAGGTVKLEIQVDKVGPNGTAGTTSDDVKVLAAVVGRHPLTLASIPYTALQTASAAVTTINDVFVDPDDEIHLWVSSELPIDPDRVRVLGVVTYTQFCRIDPSTGNNYCGTPHRTATTTASGATTYTIDPIGGGPDPLADHPVLGSVIKQIAPSYYPLQKWTYEPLTPPAPPGTSMDGRRQILSPFNNPTLGICVTSTDPRLNGQQFTLAIQGYHKLFRKFVVDRPTSEVGDCQTVPSTIGLNQPVYFSMYSEQPIVANMNVYGTISGQSTHYPVDRYHRDTSKPEIARFPFVGRAEAMSGGFHNLFVGTWNGNRAFDPSLIVAESNDSYVPLFSAPIPAEATGASLAFFGGIGDIFSDVWGYISSAAKFVWDSAVGAAKIVGSTCIKAVRALGSLAGKIMAWAICELSDESYTAFGVRHTETHSCQQGVGFVAGVARSEGHSVSGLDLIDMNGDRYPDQVFVGGIRYGVYDPVARTGKFCGGSTPSPTNCPAATSGELPGHTLRNVTHLMHSTSVGFGANIGADAQATDSQGKLSGVQVQTGLSARLSQGYSALERDIRDVNGDGLPDIIEKNGFGLFVRLNYGYRFGSAIQWGSQVWSVTNPEPTPLDILAGSSGVLVDVSRSIAGDNRPTGQTLRLEESGHFGGSAGLNIPNIAGAGAGLDRAYSRTLVDLVDVNGDGLPDQIMKMPRNRDTGELPPFKVKVNKGTSFGSEITVPAEAWPGTPILPQRPGFVQVVDIDTLEFSKSETWDWNAQVLVQTHAEANTDRKTLLSFGDIDGDGHVDHILKKAAFGDGDPDTANVYVRLNQTGKSNLLAKVTRPFGGTIEIDYTRQLNEQNVWSTPAGTTEAVDLTDGRWTMSKVRLNDDARNQHYTDNVDYLLDINGGQVTSGFYDRNEREFYGFSRVNIRHGTQSGSTFTEGDGSSKRMYFHNHGYHEQGRLFAEYDLDGAGNVLRGSVTKLDFGSTPTAPTSLTSQFLQSDVKLDLVYEKTFTALDLLAENPLAVFDLPEFVPSAPIYHQSGRGFDLNGDLVSVSDLGDPHVTTDDLLYTLHYATPAGHFRAVDAITATAPAGGAAFAKRTATYQILSGRPTLTRISDMIYGGKQPGTGTPYDGTQSSAYNFTYDALGNLRTFADPTAYTLTYTYDSTTSTHVTNVSDSFGLSSSSTPNLDFGVPSSTTDANGKTTSYVYDTFGRLTQVFGPTDPTTGTATIQMSYSQGVSAATVPWARTQHKDVQATGNTIDTVTFIDALARVIQTKKEADVRLSNGTIQNGFAISGLTTFDSRGRVLAQHQPFFDSATAATTFVPAPQKNPTVYGYDGLGRTTLVSLPDGKTRATRFYIGQADQSDDGLTGVALQSPYEATAVTDENGRTDRTYRDGAGHILATKLFHAFAAPRLQGVITTYGYDVLGHLARTTSSQGGVTTAVTDSLGRMVSLVSPDAGTTEYRYNLAGLLAEKQTPNLRGANQFIRFVYGTNRLTTIDYPSLPDVTYTYGLSTDTTGNVKGRIKRITMEGGTEDRTYDSFGNVAQTVTTLNHIGAALAAPVVTMKYTYDWLGRMQTMTFPRIVNSSWVVPTGDGEVITYTYDRGGMIDRISGKATPTSTPENYLNDVGYDEFGQRTQLVSGNSISNTYGYDTQRRFLTTINATANPSSGARQFHALTYTYDGVGNVKTISNNPPTAHIQADTLPVGVGPLSITYNYDDLDRLQSSSATYRGHRTFGHKYNTTYGYDENGALLSKSQTNARYSYTSGSAGFGGETFVRNVSDGNYSLGLTVPAGRTRPTTVDETNSAGTQRRRTMTFDNNGNNTGDSGGFDSRVFAWDEENRLKQATTNGVIVGRFLYAPSGERTQKQDAGTNSTTFYFNQFLVIHGDRNVTKHLYAGETRIASKTENASTVVARHFYHPDHLGTTSYITDNNQNLVQHENYYPSGERWFESGAEELASGGLRRDWLFTGKELDRNTSLYYFGARYLDPKLSSFMSTDPIVDGYMKGGPNGGAFTSQNMSLYSYAWNNPVRLRDPSGLATTDIQQEIKSERGEAAAALAQANSAIANADRLVAKWQEEMVAMRTERSGQHAWTTRDAAFAKVSIGNIHGDQLDTAYGVYTNAAVSLGAGAAFAESPGLLAPAVEGSGGSTFSLRFSQTTASAAFSDEGAFAGRTIGGLASDLRAGGIAPSQVPVRFVAMDGNNLIVNTRSSLALMRGGIPQSQWTLVDSTAADLTHIQARLLHNALGPGGTSTLRITGAGRFASSLR